MIIGAMRAEEAKVFDDDAGYAQFINEDGEEYGSFEVFWNEPDTSISGIAAGHAGDETDDAPLDCPGWFWWSCFPGCIPDGEPIGPFSTSSRAYADARDED